VVVTWPGPDGPSALVSTGGKKEEVANGWPGPEGPSALEREGGGNVARSRRTIRVRMGRW
jgi:hypothetical protein